jgi:anionic cell wall polymer biosynthesis LytR-Cps2A-Psr (LCP) family protein
MPKFTKYTIKPVPAAVQNVQRKSPIHGVKFSRVLIVFCAVAICLFGIAFLRSITSISALQRDDLFTSDTPAYIKKHDEKRVNILLAGVGGKNHDGGYLTDSIMLVSLDTTTSSITMFSIPRDLFVAYPAGGGGRINALYDI